MYPPEFAKRWIPPPGHDRATYYYPLYAGYHAPNVPVLFDNPMHALTWSVTRFKKDGICNAWIGQTLPDFLRFVGVIQCAPTDLCPIPMPTNHRVSKVEAHYFAPVSSFLLSETMAIQQSAIPYV